MRLTIRALASLVAILVLTNTAARAADLVATDAVEVPVAVEVRDFVIDLGIGGQIQPEFPGAEQYEIVPFGIFDLKFLRLPFFGEVVTGEERIFTIYPTIGFVGEREEDDAAFLEDLNAGDVDFAVELGAGVAVRRGFFRVFAEGRYGVTGHNGFVFEGGADLIAPLTERLEVSAGPRVSLATDDYMDTYFGVDGATLFVGGLPVGTVPGTEYDPDGGFKDVGIEAEATYAVTENILLHGRAGWSRFVGDAEDSPIVEAGDEDQFYAGIGISYRFGLDLY